MSLVIGDCRAALARWATEGVRAQCVVTSPPYWGLRDYGVEGQLGLEPTPELYVAHMVEVFRLVRDVLADDGTLWLNLGDSYAGAPVGTFNGGGFKDASAVTGGRDMSGVATSGTLNKLIGSGLKPKDLVGIPWRVAFALQADGWYLRSDIIWAKPNPMPESVTDRPTKAHEYLFLLSKRERYYYDAESVKEPASLSTHARISQDLAAQVGSYRANGGNKTNGPMRAVMAGSTRKIAEAGSGIANNRSYEASLALKVERVNRRSVWTIGTHPYPEAHFATFPPDLVTPCILAGSRPGETVLDPFMGSGTVAMVAQDLGRRWLGCELSPEYARLCERRTRQAGLVL